MVGAAPIGVPRRWLAPAGVAGAVGAAFGIGIVPTGIALIVLSGGRAGSLILLWAILAVAVAVPLGLVVGLVGRRADRVLSPVPPVRPGRWAPWGVGVATLVHWAPLCALTPWMVVLGALDPDDADEYLLQAVLSLAAWVAAGTGAGLVLVAHRLGPGPSGSSGPDPRRPDGLRVPYRPAPVPTSLVLGVAAALSALAPAGLWLVWLGDVWARGAGTAGVAAWALASAGAAVLAGWLTGAVCIGASALEPGLGVGVRVRQVEVMGAVVAGAWAAVFLCALAAPPFRAGPMSDDLRFTVLFLATAAVTAGVAVWSGARTVRTAEADVRRGVPVARSG